MTSDRTTLLVDQDGPLAGFDRHFFWRCEQDGIEVDCTAETQAHRFATDHIVDLAHRARARNMIDTPGWFRELPVVEGAVEGLNLLAEHADVWICTKPLEANETCRDDKAWWIRHHFGKEWARRLIITPDKSMIQGDVLLDDAPHPHWYEVASWVPVIFAAPWNHTGSKWADVQRWTWGDPIAKLLYAHIDEFGL